MAYSPAFQFYYKDFRQDPKTIAMRAAEIGAYWLLLMECWDRDNSLPDDVDELALIARTPGPQFAKMWNAKIRRCFRWDGERSVFWHKRLGEEIEKQKRWKLENSERGRLAAEARWDKERQKNTGDSMRTHTDAMQPNASSSSSSSSSSFSLEQHLGILLAGVQKEFGLKKLPDRKEWIEHGTLAFENGFTAQQFVECLSLMRKQDWRKYSIKAKTVSGGLPDLDKIRAEVGGLGGERLPTIDEIKAKRDEYRQVKPPPQLKAV